MADYPNKSNKANSLFHTPKNFMVPFILLCIRDINLHGYKIIQQLTEFGFASVDKGNIYRTLRQLETEEMVKSEWDTSKNGPSKRIYSLTEAGEQYLKTWANSLDQYQTMLNRFFNMYTNMFTLPISTRSKQDEDNVT